MARWRSTVLKASLVGLVPAVLIGATILYVAWTENLSMAIRDEDGVHWAYWLGLGASWAVPVFLLVTIVGDRRFKRAFVR